MNAMEAGTQELLRYFDKRFTISNKEGLNNLVTEADIASENAIIQTIQSSFPNHSILSEECGASEASDEYKWIIDPIDGTVNFANGIPICCVSIGVEYQGEMILGAVQNPFLNELFFAEKGSGAQLNGKKITVSQQSEVKHSCMVTGFPYQYIDEPNGPIQIFEKLIKRGIPVRRLGSAAIDLCWLAAGRFDAYYEHKLQSWDSAAGALMVEEAGGKVTDFSGNAYSVYQPRLLATNGKIHEKMLQVLNGGEIE